jgi:hypothetical protein
LFSPEKDLHFLFGCTTEKKVAGLFIDLHTECEGLPFPSPVNPMPLPPLALVRVYSM